MINRIKFQIPWRLHRCSHYIKVVTLIPNDYQTILNLSCLTKLLSVNGGLKLHLESDKVTIRTAASVDYSIQVEKLRSERTSEMFQGCLKSVQVFHRDPFSDVCIYSSKSAGRGKFDFHWPSSSIWWLIRPTVSGVSRRGAAWSESAQRGQNFF